MTFDILARNAKCPICGLFFHNIDINNNPIPSPKNKRIDEELCQCVKGKGAREYRRIVRMEIEEERAKKQARIDDVLSMDERNKEYWKEVTNR